MRSYCYTRLAFGSSPPYSQPREKIMINIKSHLIDLRLFLKEYSTSPRGYTHFKNRRLYSYEMINFPFCVLGLKLYIIQSTYEAINYQDCRRSRTQRLYLKTANIRFLMFYDRSHQHLKVPSWI